MQITTMPLYIIHKQPEHLQVLVSEEGSRTSVLYILRREGLCSSSVSHLQYISTVKCSLRASCPGFSTCLFCF